MKIKLAKFQLYPASIPNGYAVGFNIATINNRQFYRDVLVSFEEAKDKTDEEIMEVAWGMMKTDIVKEVERLEEINPLLGKEWEPSTLQEDMITIIQKREARKIIEDDTKEDEGEDGKEEGDGELIIK